MRKFGNGYIEKVWSNSVKDPLPLKYIPYNKDFKIFYSVWGTEPGTITVGMFVDGNLAGLATTDINRVNKSLAYWFSFPKERATLGKHSIQFKIGEAVGGTIDTIRWKYTSDKYDVEVI